MEGENKQGGCLENVKTNENCRLKGKANGVGMDVELMQSQSLKMHLSLKSLKKRIKVEKT